MCFELSDQINLGDPGKSCSYNGASKRLWLLYSALPLKISAFDNKLSDALVSDCSVSAQQRFGEAAIQTHGWDLINLQVISTFTDKMLFWTLPTNDLHFANPEFFWGWHCSGYTHIKITQRDKGEEEAAALCSEHWETYGRKIMFQILRAHRWAAAKYQITVPLPEWQRRIRAQRCGVTSPGGPLRARTGMSKRVNEVKREATGSRRTWSVNYEKGHPEQRQRQLWEASWRIGQSI